MLDIIYESIRENEVRLARSRLRKIKIDNVLQSISKSCWYYGIKDEIILKNYEMLLIKLSGKKSSVIIKYHKTDKVLLDEYEKLIRVMEFENIDKAVYITTGVFDSSIKKHFMEFNSAKNIQFVDYVKFTRKQLSLFGSAAELINKDKICFMEFMPE